MPYFVYILVSELDGSLYTGQTSNLVDRVRRHNQGSIRATKRKAPYRLGFFEVYDSRSKAMWREWELKKRWNTQKKKRLIQNFDSTKVMESLGL